MSSTENLKFEDAITKLEQIVQSMESGELPLEETIKNFTEAGKLAVFCENKLSSFEKKIELLNLEGANGSWQEIDG